MAHFNFVISQNATWGHAGFYIDCHRMTVPENILLQKSTGWRYMPTLLRTLHWLPVQQRIDYKVALLTFKVRSTSTPSYLRHLIQDRQHSHNLRLTTATFHDDDFCEVCLPMLCSGSLELTTEKLSLIVTLLLCLSLYRLKTFLFSRAFSLPSSQ